MPSIPQLYLEISATQTEPDFEREFLETGGAFSAAASRGPTDIALSGSERAVSAELNSRYATVVKIPFPSVPSLYTWDTKIKHISGMPTVYINNRSKLLLQGQRQGVAINGTLGSHEAGRGAVYLGDLLRSASHMSVPICYTNIAAHTSVFSCSEARVMDKEGKRYAVEFYTEPEKTHTLQIAEEATATWAETAWQMRTSEIGLRYEPAVALTKTVVKETQSMASTGVNDSGYDLIHNVLNMPSAHSWKTVNALVKHAVHIELQMDEQKINVFVKETSKPGFLASKHCRTLATALSTVAAQAVSYRPDGFTRMGPNGEEVVAVENMPRIPCRAYDRTGDCDDSAFFVHSIAQRVRTASTDVLNAFPYVNSARNIWHPHFVVGVGIVGATAPEASGNKDSGAGPQSQEAGVAGHAATFVLPTLQFINALHKHDESLTNARFAALYPDDVVAAFAPDEQRLLSDWQIAQTHPAMKQLRPFAIEGTTPCSSVIYPDDAETVVRANHIIKQDELALRRMGQTIGRPMRVMHVGGSDPENPHQFYKHLLEINVSRSHPLWTDTHIRNLGGASTQFCLAPDKQPTKGKLSVAGASPRDLYQGTYTAVALHKVNYKTAVALDTAAVVSDADAMPPVAASWKLDAFASSRLADSMQHIKHLTNLEYAPQKSSNKSHCLSYVIAYNSLVHNPAGVKHLCERIKSIASQVDADVLPVEGMAQTENGDQAGYMVVIHASVPLSSSDGVCQ